MSWQPIETAPRDGTRVILCRPNHAESMAVGWYSSDFGHWSLVYGTLWEDPESWHPLPELPK